MICYSMIKEFINSKMFTLTIMNINSMRFTLCNGIPIIFPPL